MALGVAFNSWFFVPLWLAIALFATTAVAALLFSGLSGFSGRSVGLFRQSLGRGESVCRNSGRGVWVGSLYSAVMLFAFGLVLSEIQQLAPTAPCDMRQALQLDIESPHSARLTAWRDDKVVASERGAGRNYNSSSGSWHACRARLVIYGDTAVRLQAGERVRIVGRIRPFSAENPQYGSLMRHRNYSGVLFVASSSILSRSSCGDVSLSERLHATAVERLRRLSLSPQSAALAEAMALGERSGFSRELRTNYARSGTAHLLAVSGLHVGIVFMIINALLWWLPVVRFGHVWRNLLSILLIWLYAATVGLSPSVVRAAVMFSMLQLSLASTSRYVSMNVLAASALLMLAFNTHYLFDISFQLSVVAVAGILAWGVPLYNLLRTHYRLLNALTAMLTVALVASVVTAPLVSHYFGYVSLVGLVVNPVAVVTAYAIVVVAIAWVLMPLALVAPLFSWALEVLATVQNGVVQAAASLSTATVDYRLSAVATVAIYTIFIALTVVMWGVKRKKAVSLTRL